MKKYLDTIKAMSPEQRPFTYNQLQFAMAVHSFIDKYDMDKVTVCKRFNIKLKDFTAFTEGWFSYTPKHRQIFDEWESNLSEQ